MNFLISVFIRTRSDEKLFISKPKLLQVVLRRWRQDLSPGPGDKLILLILMKCRKQLLSILIEDTSRELCPLILHGT